MLLLLLLKPSAAHAGGSTAHLAVVMQTMMLRPGRVPGQHGWVGITVPGICPMPHSIAHEHAQPLVAIILAVVPFQRICKV